jgi:hypothetical protein
LEAAANLGERRAQVVAGRSSLWRTFVVGTLGLAALWLAAPAYADDPPVPPLPSADATASLDQTMAATADSVAASVDQAVVNANVSVRVLSPGSDGQVTQTTASPVVATAQPSVETAANPAIPAGDTSSLGVDTAATGTDDGPANTNVSVRVLSPGDNGGVTQVAGASDLTSSMGETAATPASAPAEASTSGQYQASDSQYQPAAPTAEPTSTDTTSGDVDPSWNWVWNWNWNCGAPTDGSWVMTNSEGGTNWTWNWTWISSCISQQTTPGQYQQTPGQYQLPDPSQTIATVVDATVSAVQTNVVDSTATAVQVAATVQTVVQNVVESAVTTTPVQVAPAPPPAVAPVGAGTPASLPWSGLCSRPSLLSELFHGIFCESPFSPPIRVGDRGALLQTHASAHLEAIVGSSASGASNPSHGARETSTTKRGGGGGLPLPRTPDEQSLGTPSSSGGGSTGALGFFAALTIFLLAAFVEPAARLWPDRDRPPRPPRARDRDRPG